MSDSQAQFSVLKQTADPKVADAIRELIETGEDHELNRINVLDFSARTGLDEEQVISGFLHASRLGLFDLTWNVLCPGCGGVLDAHSTLKSLRHDDYHCGLCACGYEASVDEQVEVAFTVSPRVRRIAAHDPNTLPIWEYFKQIFWSSGVDLNEESFASLTDEVMLDALELPAREKAVLSLQLPAQFIIVFEPVTHAAQFIDVQGEPTKERQQLSLIYNKMHAPAGTIDVASGPVAAVARQPGRRAGAAVGLHRRRCASSSDRQAQAVPHRQADADQPDLPRCLQGRQSQHRSAPQDHLADVPVHRPQGLDRAVRAGRRSRRIRSGARAFPRTSGDHLFREGRGGEDDRRCRDGDLHQARTCARRGLADARRHGRAERQRGTKDLVVKIGIHEGPCLAVMLNERQDYFGQTVNIAARVQGLSTSHAIHITGPVIDAPAVTAILDKEAITPIQKQAALRGIADKIVVYEIP